MVMIGVMLNRFRDYITLTYLILLLFTLTFHFFLDTSLAKHYVPIAKIHGICITSIFNPSAYIVPFVLTLTEMNINIKQNKHKTQTKHFPHECAARQIPFPPPPVTIPDRLYIYLFVNINSDCELEFFFAALLPWLPTTNVSVFQPSARKVRRDGEATRKLSIG